MKQSGFPNCPGISNEAQIDNKLTVEVGAELLFATDERLNYVIPFSSSEQKRHQRDGKCSLMHSHNHTHTHTNTCGTYNVAG